MQMSDTKRAIPGLISCQGPRGPRGDKGDTVSVTVIHEVCMFARHGDELGCQADKTYIYMYIALSPVPIRIPTFIWEKSEEKMGLGSRLTGQSIVLAACVIVHAQCSW